MLVVWKQVKGYEGLYEISSEGSVRSLDRINYGGRGGSKRVRKGALMKLNDCGRYLDVQLWKNGKVTHKLIHRLIAEVFLPNKDNLPQVNHIDEDTYNNTIQNLEWTTAQQNSEHSNAKHYSFYNPQGLLIEVFNLRQFCKGSSLNRGHMSSVSTGNRKSHKGWTKA